MAVISMTKTDFDSINSNTGAIFSDLIEIADGETSDIYLLPVIQIYAFAVNLTGDGILYVTNDPPSVIRDGGATWVAWDGLSEINVGITAVKVESTSGDVTARITAKTAD